MEALIAAKSNPTKVHRTSLTKHMHDASVTLHAAINSIKPGLMKRHMLRELAKGVAEVTVLEQKKHELQSQDRIICEELVALNERRYEQSVEVAKEKRRLARCLENLETKEEIRNEAAEELKRADDPAEFLQEAVAAAERMTEKRMKDFVAFVDNKTEGILQSTKYAFDVLSILLGESMPIPKEVPIVLHIAYEDIVSGSREGKAVDLFNDANNDASVESESSRNDDDGEHSQLEEEAIQKEEKEEQEDKEEKEVGSLDIVSRATAEHRKAIGLAPVTKRTSQQSAFLNALVPKSSNTNSDNDNDNDDDKLNGSMDEEEGSSSTSVVVNPEEAVKAYSRSTRQSVIEQVGRDDWVYMSWGERLEHMLEFSREEEKEEPFETVEDYEDDVFARDARYFESTVDEGTSRHPDGDQEIQKKHIKHRKGHLLRPGILSNERFLLVIPQLRKLAHEGGQSLTSLVNDEKHELMEGYLDFQNICRYTLWLGRSGQLSADIWAWIMAVLDYAHALPIYKELTDLLEQADQAVLVAQGIFDVAEAREADSSLKLKKLSNLIPQTAWYLRRQEKWIKDHIACMKARTKWPVYLRSLDAPAKFTVMVQQVASMRGRQARLLKDFQIALAEVHCRTNELAKAGDRLDLVRKEVSDILCPWNWYMPDGRKWASIIHNKWFVESCRVTVFDEETGIELPATLTEVEIHKNGRGRWATAKYDGGGSDNDIPHYRIKLQYPQQVPMARAMEDYEEKFVTTQFDTACETTVLLNIKLMVPRLEKHLNQISLVYEDARTELRKADQTLRFAATRVLQCLWRRYKRSSGMKKVRTWKSGEKMRAFLSTNLIKFHKMRERNNAFTIRFLSRVKGSINIQRMVRGHLARIVYWDMLDAIAEAERERLEQLEKRRQEKEFANRLRAAQVAKERTKSWRCPRCPLSVAFKQRFTSPQQIEAHIAVHEKEDLAKLQAIEDKEAYNMEQKRLEALARASKEEMALAKMRRLMDERRIKLEEEAIVKAKKQREKKLQQMNALFTIKYQRPVLPSLRKGGFKLYKNDDFVSTKLSPPYPELRLIKNALRPLSAKRMQRGNKRKKSLLLPEKIFITCSPFRFGRSRSCDAPVDCYQHSGVVSKDHALIFVRGSPMVGYTLILADLHSTNGTFLDQKRVKAGTGTEYDRNNRTMEDGAIVVFGCTKAQPTPENPSGNVLSSVCYQLWKNGSGFHDNSKIL